MLPFGVPGSPLPTPYCWEYEIFIDSTRSLLNDNQQEVCHAVGLTISPGILCFGCSAEVTLVVLYRTTVYVNCETVFHKALPLWSHTC